MTGAGDNARALNNFNVIIRSVFIKTGENKDLSFCFLYISAVSAGEIILTRGGIYGGMAVHLLLFAALIVHSSLEAGSRSLYLSLAVAPLIRILSLSMPLGMIPAAYWYAIIGLPIYAAAYVVARVNGYSLYKIGLNTESMAFQLLFSLTGLGLGYIEYNILKPAPLAAAAGLADILLTSAILLIFTGLLEEMVFRGIMFNAFREAFNNKFAVGLSSALFTALHITYNIPLDVVFVFAVALLFSWAVIRFRSILGVSLAHGLTNISLFVIFPPLLR